MLGNSYAAAATNKMPLAIAGADVKFRIFERFYRVDSDRSRKTGGTGLGLAIAMAIAQHHHGRLMVESAPDQGSIFPLHLP